jgi:hypothetical protein
MRVPPRRWRQIRGRKYDNVCASDGPKAVAGYVEIRKAGEQNMKIFKTVAIVFALVGIGMLVGTFLLIKSTSAFMSAAIPTMGTVVQLVARQSSGSGSSTTYAPKVQFTTQAGARIEFVSSASANPPSYASGEQVEVLYLQSAPEQARINGFFSIWGAPLILGSLGFIFTLAGGGILSAGIAKGKRDAFLKSNGRAIAADVERVGENTSVTSNGRHPFCIYAQWQDPASSKIYSFQSDDIWFDPAKYVGKQVKVMIDPNDPKRYYMDLEFLPQAAN